MQLEVYDKHTRVRLDLIKMVKYVQYSKRFNGVGNFEIKVPINESSLKFLVEGNYIYFEDNVVGVIKYRDKETSESTEVIIKGYLVNVLLTYRSFLLTKNYRGKIAEVAKNMVEDLCINNQDTRRNISCITTQAWVPDSPNVVTQKTGDILNVAVEELLSTIGYGYDLYPSIIGYDEEKGTNIESFVFVIIKPEDRTIGNKSDNNPVVFSLEMNNISNMSFIEDSTKYCNAVIIAGEGEGLSRTIVEAGDTTSSDIDRIELYVDARDLQSTKDDGGEQLTPEEYEELLIKRGEEKLEDNTKYINFDGSVLVNENTSFKYNSDFFLGDYVTIVDKQINLQFNLQVSEVVKTITENGEEKLDVKFGKERATMQELIKRGGILNG